MRFRQSSLTWKEEVESLKAKNQLLVNRHKSQMDSLKAELEIGKKEIESLQV